MVAAREHLPRERVLPTVSVLSVCLVAGVGLGYPLSGLVVQTLGMRAAFWVGAATTTLALAWAGLAMPRTTRERQDPLDLLGSLLLAVGLVSTLLAVAAASAQGWLSPSAIAPMGGGVVVLAVWVTHQLRTPYPLIDLRQLRHPAVRTADTCAFVYGVALYMFLSVVSVFVQAPRSTGYGLEAPIVVSGLTLLAVVRLVAFSLGSAVTGQVLHGHTSSGATYPTETGYQIVLWSGVAVCAAAALVGSGPRRLVGSSPRHFKVDV